MSGHEGKYSGGKSGDSPDIRTKQECRSGQTGTTETRVLRLTGVRIPLPAPITTLKYNFYLLIKR